MFRLNRYLVVYLLIPTSNHNLLNLSMWMILVVYLLIPTSNHNMMYPVQTRMMVVYLLIPTSNHNFAANFMLWVKLYIF